MHHTDEDNTIMSKSVAEQFRTLWDMLTDDESACYESDDGKFHAMLKQKYGISRDDFKRLRFALGN